MIKLRKPRKIPQVSADLQKQKVSPAPDRSVKGMQTLNHVTEGPEGQYGARGRWNDLLELTRSSERTCRFVRIEKKKNTAVTCMVLFIIQMG